MSAILLLIFYMSFFFCSVTSWHPLYFVLYIHFLVYHLIFNSLVWINTHLISMPYSALIWLHILPIPFHCYCHTNCIRIASLCTVYLSTRVYNYCFMKLCFIRCRKELWKTIYIVFCIDSCSYLYWCSLFLSVNLNYCLVSFHLSLKLSLCYFLQGSSSGNEFYVFVYQRMF